MQRKLRTETDAKHQHRNHIRRIRLLVVHLQNDKASDWFTEELNEAVNVARRNDQWEVEYMNWRAYEMDINIDKRIAREEGLEEGRREGREIGLQEGRAEGKAAGEAEINQLYQMLLDSGRVEDLKRAIADQKFRAGLMKDLVSE